jgi:putative tryptophan/tyrosine transport system substrate-binding protein
MAASRRAPLDRRVFLGALTSALVGSCVRAGAQPAGKVYRIGFLVTANADEMRHVVNAFREGLRERGYVEGRNVVLETRFAEGRQERLPALAAELARLNLDVIVTGSNPVIAAVKEATATIPIVMAVSRDPVGSRFIASLAHPGGNITGMANDPLPEIFAKNLAILKEAAPRLSRVAFLWNPVPPGAEAPKKAVESAARNLGLAFQSVEIRAGNECEAAFASIVRERANGVVVAQDPLTLNSRSQIVRLSERSRIPAVYPVREFSEIGGLMSYGPNLVDQFRRAATYVDKILKGARPSELPIEQPTKFELVINLKTAKTLGLTIPQSLLVQADQVIE